MRTEMIKNKLKELGCKVFNLNLDKQMCIFVYKSGFYITHFRNIYGTNDISILIKEAKQPETISDLRFL